MGGERKKEGKVRKREGRGKAKRVTKGRGWEKEGKRKKEGKGMKRG